MRKDGADTRVYVSRANMPVRIPSACLAHPGAGNLGSRCRTRPRHFVQTISLAARLDGLICPEAMWNRQFHPTRKQIVVYGSLLNLTESVAYYARPASAKLWTEASVFGDPSLSPEGELGVFPASPSV